METEKITIAVSFSILKQQPRRKHRGIKPSARINGAGLRDHLLNTEPHTAGIYYIKVTGLMAADLKRDDTLL